MIDALFEQHHGLSEAAAAVIAEASRNDIDLFRLGRLRSTLAMALKTHLELEEHAIFGPLRRLPEGAAALPVEAMREEIRSLRLVYSTHIGIWRSDAIRLDAAGYRIALQDLVRRMRILEEREEQLLYTPARRILATSHAAAA